MDMEQNTAKHFVLQLGSLISLYLSLSFLLVLVFGIINMMFPDQAEAYWTIERNGYSVRLGIAMVIVFFPTYLLLTRTVNRLRRRESSGAYLGLTRWLIYLSLLVSGLVLLGDLVAVIMAFLEGEITQRFIFKAAAVLLVIGMAFHYYLLDARGFWLKHEDKSIMYAIGASLVVFLAIAFGFSNVEAPAMVREMKLDERQVQDLQNIQWQIENYYVVSSSTLPETLEEAYNGDNSAVPMAPEDREGYSYEMTDGGFSLCATFSSDSPDATRDIYSTRIDPEAPIKNANNWSYQSGRYCFKRVVN